MKDDEQNEVIFSDEEKKLYKKYLDEYNDIYQKILILSESEFNENIKKRVEIALKSKIKNYSSNTLLKIEKYIKEEVYTPDYKLASIIKKNILNRTKREIALHYFRGEIIPHCGEDKRDDYYIHTCGERFQFFRYKINNNFPNNNLNNLNNINHHQGIHYDYILYCIKCNMIYKSSLIKFKCYTNDTEFYSKLLINNDDYSNSKNKEEIKNICHATWRKYHCNAIINDTMKCEVCDDNYLFIQDKNVLYCTNCKIKKKPLDIVWKCLICQKEFQAEAKIYNPLEYKSLKICVKDAIVNKKKAKPEYMTCKCNINIDNTRFFHKAACKGELYLGEINAQKVVVCGKCDTLGLYEGYIWTCPKCMKRFKTKKREGSVCTKLGLSESLTEKKEKDSNNNKFRNLSLSDKNIEKYNDIKSSINDINNYLNEKNNTISNDTNILNYLNDIKDKNNINKINNTHMNNSKDSKKRISNINKKRIKNPVFSRLLSNSFLIEDNSSSNYHTSNLSFSEKCIPDVRLRKYTIANSSSNTKFSSNYITGSSCKELLTKAKNESSNDTNFKSPRYIINNFKKMNNNFHIKNNFHLKTDNKNNSKGKEKDKDKDIDIGKNSQLYSTLNYTKKNDAFPINNTNQKVLSESKDKNSKCKDEELLLQNDDYNQYNTRKLSSYKKPYYSINNSFIKSLKNEYRHMNSRKSESIIYTKTKNNNKENLNLLDNLETIENNNNTLNITKNDNEKKSVENIKDKNKQGVLYSAIEATKKKYKKKNNKAKNKKYLYNNKDKNIKSENKILVKELNFADMSIKDVDSNKKINAGNINESNKKNNNNMKSNRSIKLGKNNNININININNNSTQNLNENCENMNEINSRKRMYSNSIIMNNLTINDKDNVFDSLKITQNNSAKKNKTILGNNNNMNNINSINNINTNININNINNNLHYYNKINNFNYSNSKKNNSNYPMSYKKKLNKNSESTAMESDPNTKNNKNSITCSINNSSKQINNNQNYLFNQKFTNFSEYKLIKQIGKGTFGQIFMVENNQHQCFALKKLIATNLKDIKTLEHEYQILLDIQSHGKKINLVQIYGIETKQLDPTTFVMYVLMELASTDWEKEILTRHNMNNYYSENELMTIISSLINTFAQLQKEKISHRDIKPQNILIFNDSKTYKLADFGEAKELLGDDRPTERQTLRGTELYMSPILFYALRSRQIIKYVKHNPYKSDLFSFGLCCLFAATLCFESIYDVRELRNNTAIKYIIQKYLGSRYSNVVINIICSMLDVNENSRNDFIEMEKEIKKIGY